MLGDLKVRGWMWTRVGYGRVKQARRNLTPNQLWRESGVLFASSYWT